MKTNKNKYIVSIDLGGTVTKIALIDRNFKIKKKNSYLTATFAKSRKSLISKLVDECNILLRKNNVGKHQVLGIGVSQPVGGSR